MKTPSFQLRRCAAALVGLFIAAFSSAHATVSGPGSTIPNGEMFDISYGATGNVFQLTPVLFVPGLGNADLPSEVTKLTSSLTFDFIVAASSVNSSMLVVNYVIRNVSASESFNNIRFSALANPDGEQVNFLDQFSESWGAATAQGPVARETRAFEFDPALTMLSKALESGGLQDSAPSAACTSAAGCDGVFGLQWNVAALNPGEVLTVSLGLSDKGNTLSSRFLRAVSLDNVLTDLTFSGVAVVSPVPEPSTGVSLLAGLAAVSYLVRRKSRRQS